MAPSYKLHYFNGRGAAEHIRFILSHAGVQFEDIRYKHEDWPKHKKDTPYGQLPVLEVDGKKVAQSNSIARYLARKYKLAGKDDWESLQCDEIVDAVADMKTVIWKFVMEKNENLKAEQEKIIKTEKIPLYMGVIDKKIAQNKGFTVGNQLTWSDLVVAIAVETLQCYFKEEKLEKYPNVKALKEKVFAIPSIAAWVAKRPESDF